MIRAARLFALASSCLSIVGCGNIEYDKDAKHTPEEFVEHHKRGTLMRGTKEIEVKRPRKTVEADLTEYVSKCVDGVITHSRLVQGMQVQQSKVKHTAKLRASGDGKSILWIQTKELGYNGPWKAHPDGYYFFAAEIEPMGAKTTKVTSYYLTMSEPFSVEVQDWATGVKKKCWKDQLR
jgi:hypothetical protein